MVQRWGLTDSITHSIPANNAPTFPKPFPLRHIPFPISLKTSRAFCAVFNPDCDCWRKRGSSYANDEDMREKNAPITSPNGAKPDVSSQTGLISEEMQRTTTSRQRGLSYTRFHADFHELLIFLTLQHLCTVFLRDTRRQRLSPGWKYRCDQRPWHVQEIVLPARWCRRQIVLPLT